MRMIIKLVIFLKFLLSLNPYSIGRYSMSVYPGRSSSRDVGLNPYSIGRYSMRLFKFNDSIYRARS